MFAIIINPLIFDSSITPTGWPPERKPGTATVNGDCKMNTSTPTTLESLKYQDWVIDLKQFDTPQKAANEVLNQLFPDDRPAYVRHLFTEGDVKVYEAYKDSGSDDYIYIKETI
jgi:hypothetical protein